MFVLGFVVPLCIISFCYGMIIIKVRKSEKNAKKNVFKAKTSSSLGNTRPSRSRIIVINRIARLLTNALAEPLARYGFKKDAEKVQVGLPTNNSRESNARRQLNTFVASILSTFVVCRLPWYIWHIIKVQFWHWYHIILKEGLPYATYFCGAQLLYVYTVCYSLYNAEMNRP